MEKPTYITKGKREVVSVSVISMGSIIEFLKQYIGNEQQRKRLGWGQGNWNKIKCSSPCDLQDVSTLKFPSVYSPLF